MNTLLADAPAPSTDVATPAPLHTTVITDGDGVGGPRTKVVRTWAASDAEACDLCPAGECRAARTRMLVIGPRGVVERARVCTVSVVGTVDPKSAPLFRLPGR